MSSNHRRDRMVSPRSLSTPEAPEPLATPEEASPPPVKRGPRLNVADIPLPSDLHWLDVWRSGVAAALECETPAEARALPLPEDVGCRDCWLKGRNAVVAKMGTAPAD